MCPPPLWDVPPLPPFPPLPPDPLSPPQPLQPVVHIWDSATLLTLQQIGLGSFERGVGSLAFSTAVSPSARVRPSVRVRVCPPYPIPLSPSPQDHGAYLCVVDDSNEHMMSVWDCARGTKQAEVKVRGRCGVVPGIGDDDFLPTPPHRRPLSLPHRARTSRC